MDLGHWVWVFGVRQFKKGKEDGVKLANIFLTETNLYYMNTLD